jgi:hypothetical protein
MMRRHWPWIVVAILIGEAISLGLYGDQARPVARSVYVWLWNIAPQPAGARIPPPDRFIDK